MHPRLCAARRAVCPVWVEVAAGFALYVLGSLLLLHLIATQGARRSDRAALGRRLQRSHVPGTARRGALADAGLRLQRAVRLGAILLSFGFVALALRRDARLGLSISVLGNGLFRQTWLRCSVAYTPSVIRALDAAYRVFYRRIQLRGLVAPPLAGLFRADPKARGISARRL